LVSKIIFLNISNFSLNNTHSYATILRLTNIFVRALTLILNLKRRGSSQPLLSTANVTTVSLYYT